MGTPQLMAAELTFSVSGLRSGYGQLYVGLFKGKNNYQANKAQRWAKRKITSDNLRLSFNDIPEGEYVIRYFHDQNNNQKMDMNVFNMPQEGFGFSNNAKPNMGAPSYEAMKFIVDEAGVTLNHSEIIYP